MTSLKIGDKAPDFTSHDENGNEISLSDFRGKKVILFFYPKDDSPSCTKEACSLRDKFKYLQKAGYEVIGISPDKSTKHRKFIDKYELPYSLVADTEKEIINAYELWGPKFFMGREIIGVHRTTFLVDEEGHIEHIITKVITKDHAGQILNYSNQPV